MPRHVLLAIAFFALVLPGCRTTKKPSASIYAGDGPSIRYYHEAESAGGPVRTKRYH